MGNSQQYNCFSRVRIIYLSSLILYFELLFCFETVFKNSLFICSFFSCYNISDFYIYLTIKRIYIASHMSGITNSFQQVQYKKQ